MNEKICPNCGKQNPAEMSFCLNCGQSLAASGSGQSFPVSEPTVFVTPKTQPNAQPSFHPLTPQIPPAPKKSRMGFYLAIFGGIGLILILIFAGIVGMIAMNWDKITADDNENNKPSRTNTNVAVPNSRSSRANRNAAVPDEPITSSSPTFATTPDPSSSDNPSSTAPSAKLDDIRVDYDVKEGGRAGMRIHVKFTVNNLKGVESYLAIYFETRDGKRLLDKNKKYYSADGTVAVYKELKPGFDVTDYNDLTVFMPYDELDLGRGKYELRMDADVIYKAGGLIQHLGYHEFDYSE